MKRLTAYVARLFVVDSLALFGIVCVLLWLVNCLRLFDTVAVKGQGLFTLAWQALLALPPLALTFFYVCIGIGMARALQALAQNRELHIAHTTGSTGSVWKAAGIVAAVGTVLVLLLSNFLEPYANRRLTLLSAEVAADLVTSTLKPERFTQVSEGVVLRIGGRSGNGEITDFFADDRRDPDTRRTYIAQSARVSEDAEGYVLELRDGTLQYIGSDGRFSQVSFTRYNLSVTGLAQAQVEANRAWEKDSITLVRERLETGEWGRGVWRRLTNRLGEGLKVIGICLIVLALAAFPSGRRARIAVPLEVVVVLIAFVELGVSAYSPLGGTTGGWAMILIGGGTLMWRLRPRRRGSAVPA